MNNSTILVTGGTGSFGRRFAATVLQRFKLRKLIVFSRDEYKQSEMSKQFPPGRFPVRYFLGDIRDKTRLCRAFEGVDGVVHAAALKQVPALEYNPMEAVKTNIIGADNIVESAIDAGVQRVVALSTDKAVGPVNLYGATKLVAEKTFVAANAYAGGKVRFSVVRYGNVVGSRGSVIPVFLRYKREGVSEFPITDARMTRFWMTLDQSVQLVLDALQSAAGGEILVPKIPSMRIVDLARAIEPDCTFRTIGIRPGEKIHETLICDDEARYTREAEGRYVIMPQFYHYDEIERKYRDAPAVKEGFRYTSDTNAWTLDAQQLRSMIGELSDEAVAAVR